MDALLESLLNFWESTGIYKIINSVEAQWWQTIVMLLIVFVLAYLAIKKGFEPLLLLPIACGSLVVMPSWLSLSFHICEVGVMTASSGMA